MAKLQDKLMNRVIHGKLTLDSEDDVLPAINGKDIEVKSINAEKVTGDEIVENMEGYSFSVKEETGWTKDIAYAGVVKNGNKLTLVISGNYMRTSESADAYVELGKFTIPKAVNDKLYPIFQSFIDFRIIEVFVSLGDSTPVRVYTDKTDDTHLTMNAYANTTVNKSYNYRYELTFLLGENLAGN